MLVLEAWVLFSYLRLLHNIIAHLLYVFCAYCEDLRLLRSLAQLRLRRLLLVLSCVYALTLIAFICLLLLIFQ